MKLAQLTQQAGPLAAINAASVAFVLPHFQPTPNAGKYTEAGAAVTFHGGGRLILKDSFADVVKALNSRKTKE